MGSFTSPDTIAKSIKETSKPEAEQAAESKTPTYLPAFIDSGVYGRMPYAEFKRVYQTIWDQVRTKEYLLSGRVTYVADIAGNRFTLRSLKRREEQALALWEPSAVPENADQKPDEMHAAHGRRVAIQVRNASRQLVVQLSGNNIQGLRIEVPDLTPETAAAWLDNDAVKQSLAVLDALDNQIATSLLDLIYDMNVARRQALLENLRNPSQPPSPTNA